MNKHYKIILTIFALVIILIATLTLKKELNKEDLSTAQQFDSQKLDISSLVNEEENSSILGDPESPDIEKTDIKIFNERLVDIVSSGFSTLSVKGKNNNGQLITTLPRVAISIVAGQSHAGFLSENGEVYEWGGNEVHQVNESEDVIVKKPFRIKIPERVVSLQSTNTHSLALTEYGNIYGWGYNYTGQLGTGDNKGQKIPVKISGLPKVKDISAGYKFSLAISNSNEVYAWGAKCAPASERAILDFAETLATQSGYYEPTISDIVRKNANEDCLNEEVVGILSLVPKKLVGADNVSAVSSGYGHGIILKKDGTVWTFGCNLYGQLGNGKAINENANSILRKVSELKNIKMISAGFRHSLALDSDGIVYEWGGRVVEGNVVEKNTEVRTISGLPKIIKIFAGRDYSLALTETGELYGWGSNNYNILSNGKNSFESKPVKIDISKVVDVAAGQDFFLAIKK